MKFFWTDKQTGKTSTSKAWRNIAFAVATYTMVRYATTPEWWVMWLIYLGAVAGVEFVQKALTMKVGSREEKT